MLNGKVLMTIGIIIAAIATVTSALADDGALKIEREVKLKEKAEISSTTVCLSDLVDDSFVLGRCAVDRSLCCNWKLEGEHSRTFKRVELQRTLSRLNFGAMTITLRGPDEVVVTQSRRELTAAEIERKIVAALEARFGEDAKSAAVTSLKTAVPVYIPLDQESSWDVLLPEQVTERANVRIISTEEAGQTLGWAQATLRVDGEAYVARKTVRPGDVLRSEDFEIRKLNILAAQAAGETLFRKDQFPEAVRARQSILVGTPLAAAAIERIPMVRLGDTVTLILRSDNLRISTKGVVQGSAAIGDMVTVQLSRYNRTFRGRLVEGRLVEVWL